MITRPSCTSPSRQSKELERSAIAKCESGAMSDALADFDRAVAAAPGRASVFNNRAQLHRLMGRADLALEDLDKAIELSGGRGRSACQAYCQRGECYASWKLERTVETDETGEGRKFVKYWVSLVPKIHVIDGSFHIIGSK